MAEATVHTLFEAEVVEWLDEVGPVEMSVDTEHLAEDGLANFGEVRGEAAALTDPVTLAGELRKRGGQSGWASWDRGVCAGSIEATRGICCA